MGVLPGRISTVQAASLSAVPAGYIGIYTASDLASIQNNLSGNYILMNDIDLSSWGNWSPIGTLQNCFTGVFNGNGYSIRGLNISNETFTKYAGLFGCAWEAEISNIKCVDGTISTLSSAVGSIAADAYFTDISNCGSTVNISVSVPDTADYQGVVSVGGIVGSLYEATLSCCYFDGSISFSSASDSVLSFECGGLVGNCNSGISGVFIDNSFNSGNITYEKKGSVNILEKSAIGGIAGGYTNTGRGGIHCIKNCYNTGKFKNIVDAGSILGWMHSYAAHTIENCYALNDGYDICGSESKSSPYHIQATLCTDSDMQKQSTYSGFDFNTVWQMGSGGNLYPVHRWRTGETSASAGTSTDNKTVCTKHQYKSASGNRCTVCGYVYEPQLFSYNKTLYATANNVPVRDNYYANSSKVVKKLRKGDAVKVTHWLINALGNNWYVTEDGYYIYVKNLSKTSPNAHTVTFHANGGSNGPGSVTTSAARYRVPESDIPTRTGYSFCGWSTKKSATTAEYLPGQAVPTNKDLTLYAVWEKKKYDLDSVPGVDQHATGDSGTCTSAATAVILARKLIVDGKENETFTYKDVRNSCGSGFRMANMSNGTTTYSLKTEKLSSAGGNRKLIANTTIPYLLDQHPEGIVVYFDYMKDGIEKPHAIVISDYKKLSNGKYQFYAYDSALSSRLGRMEIEKTWLWTDALKLSSSATYEELCAHLNDDDNFGAKGVWVWYIEKEV